jgi:hypothetical protein
VENIPAKTGGSSLSGRQSPAQLCLCKRAPSSTDEGRAEQVEQSVLGVSSVDDGEKAQNEFDDFRR